MPHTSIYWTREEAEFLEDYCKVNGCTKSAALKHGLMLLSQGAQGYVPSPGEHDGELRITQQQLKEWIEKVRVEEKRKRQEEIDMMPVRQAEASVDRIFGGKCKK